MYALAEYGAFVVMVVLGGGFTFGAVAIVLIIMEGVHAATRPLRAR